MDDGSGQTYVDRTQCKRDRPMQVLCLGPGRTGTDSMRVALKTLGFDDCYHGYSCVHENPPDNYLWQRALDWKLEGKGTFGREEWDQLLGHCRAVTDLPCVLFAKELIETYPEAKVIWTDPPKGFDRWYKSCCETIVALKDDWTRDAWALVNHEAAITRHTFFRSFDAFWRGDFKQNARDVFHEQYELVRSMVPEDRFLEYSVIEGWEPLASFLDVPVPKTGFPAGNDPQNFFRRFAAADSRRRKSSMMTIAGVAAGIGATVLLAFRCRDMLGWQL